jgi:hypothetical protein
VSFCFVIKICRFCGSLSLCSVWIRYVSALLRWSEFRRMAAICVCFTALGAGWLDACKSCRRFVVVVVVLLLPPAAPKLIWILGVVEKTDVLVTARAARSLFVS